MTEPRAPYTVHEEAQLAELLRLFTPGELCELLDELRAVAETGHGQVWIRWQGGRKYIRRMSEHVLGKCEQNP